MATAFGGNEANFRVGNHRVTWNSIDMGFTVAGSVITIKETYRDRTGDQTGVTVLDRVLTGEMADVNLKLREFTPTNIAKVLSASTGSGGPPQTTVKGGGALAGTVSQLAKSH